MSATKTKRRRAWIVPVVVVVLVAGAAGAGYLVLNRDQSSAAAAAVTLEPATAPGADPFSQSVAIGPAVQFPGNVQQVATSLRKTLPADPTTHTLIATGTTPALYGGPGLYGGSGNVHVCDPQQLVTFLQQHPDKAAAWAGVLGIAQNDIATYVASLTPVVLTSDTRVTNHGFRDGHATSLQSVLQAGTAVMVDATGTPRVKCNCGNPLTPPEPITLATVKAAGTAWPGYAPSSVTTVKPGASVASLTLLNTTTADTYVQPVGSATVSASSTTTFSTPGSTGSASVGVTRPVVAAGQFNTCALLAAGTVKCWGDNRAGGLGDGTNTNSTTPVAVRGITDATALAAGGNPTVIGAQFGCAVLGDTTVKCWGEGGVELGNGTTRLPFANTPVPVVGLTGATAVSVNEYHACALLTGGAVKCWGTNRSGELGDGTETDSGTPVAVAGLGPAQAIVMGNGYTCALLTDGTVKCWGANTGGILGSKTLTSSRTPVAIPGLSGVTAISGNTNHVCVVLSDTTVKCWGDNAGDLGDPTLTTTYAYTPVTVAGLSGATAVAVGSGHSCALLNDATVKCWGSDGAGALGPFNPPGTQSVTPVPVVGLSGVASLSAGEYHTCAVLTDHSVKCWGQNSSGQLGDGTTTASARPVTVTGL